MPGKTTKPYGLWPSPISAASLKGDLKIEDVQWDDDGQTLVWLEGRAGKGTLVAQTGAQGQPRDLSGDFNVRASVGYGGGEFTVRSGWAFFVAHPEGRLYRVRLSGGAPEAITPTGTARCASPHVGPGLESSSANRSWMVFVQHTEDGEDRLAAINLDRIEAPSVLVRDHDFFLYPRLGPDARHLAFVAWDHPSMPWDSSRLFLVELSSSAEPETVGPPKQIAGSSSSSILQPEFSGDGRSITYVSDEDGWGKIWRYDIETEEKQLLTSEDGDHGTPAWVQGLRTYSFSNRFTETQAEDPGPNARRSWVQPEWGVVARSRCASRRLYSLSPGGESKLVAPLADFSEVGQPTVDPAGTRVAAVVSSGVFPPQLVWFDRPADRASVVRRSRAESIAPVALSSPEPVSWETTGDDVAHGLFYPPASDRFESSGLPPLLVLVHGGPTSQATAGWHPQTQFFATRGFAVLRINYRGSTGYGRSYMRRLDGQWGVYDVDDAVLGARSLAAQKRVDTKRMAIAGGSAGGYTALMAMIRYPQDFAAGLVFYGVTDLFALAEDTHKFEKYYLDRLVGTLPAARDIYRDRSPLFGASRIEKPLAIFQGQDDTVVPKSQSDRIVEALRQNRIPHVYHVYPGEGHGFRSPDTIEHWYSTMDDFLKTHVVGAASGS